ncbi:hypothetical protein RO07_14870 [Pandoraea pulmonicola]|uniref:Uncharacterized protein n=1 Tax=Pandoraea pulmonicola TaxID=93221 RepID=A0ABM5S142_PANPU|nr:hypothetical protein RO07_14870 [Pandoraea pulmonicola]
MAVEDCIVPEVSQQFCLKPIALASLPSCQQSAWLALTGYPRTAIAQLDGRMLADKPHGRLSKNEHRQFLKLEPATLCGTLVLRKTGKGAPVFCRRVTVDGKSVAWALHNGAYCSTHAGASTPGRHAYTTRLPEVA